MTEPSYPGQPWFPPDLDPAVGQAISDEWWDVDPHYAAYLAWTYYAATLPPALSVASVGTGAQNVQYSPATDPSAAGAAMQRAEWHLEQSSGGGLVSVPLMANAGLREALGGLEPGIWPVYLLPARPQWETTP
jgi:hypothetical protein